MAVLTRELGVDLGTSNIVFAEGNQVLLQEPTLVAVLVDEDKMVEWGQAAKDMVGRVPDTIEIISPVQHGVIAEYEITETLLGYLTRKIVGPMRVFRPRMMIAVPYGVTSVEGRAFMKRG
jgi:rod shape-determining protein MreB